MDGSEVPRTLILCPIFFWGPTENEQISNYPLKIDGSRLGYIDERFPFKMVPFQGTFVHFVGGKLMDEI